MNAASSVWVSLQRSHRAQRSQTQSPMPSVCVSARFHSLRIVCSRLSKRKGGPVQKFEYASPTTKEQAVALLGKEWGETEVLAGGTDLLSLMKDFIVTPKRVVNIKEVTGLDQVVTPRDGSARIGALASIDRLIETLGKGFPAITQAAAGITSPQIRNMGTVAGDLCQRPRCWYYRAGLGLLAKSENGEPLVPTGDNRYHAI